MTDVPPPSLALSFLAELFRADQLVRSRLGRAMPRGMELSHFLVLDYLAQSDHEQNPADLAKALDLTRGAMTNTLGKLEQAGHVHIFQDWNDARRKLVSISPAGQRARNVTFEAIEPILDAAIAAIGEEEVEAALPVLRGMSRRFGRD